MTDEGSAAKKDRMSRGALKLKHRRRLANVTIAQSNGFMYSSGIKYPILTLLAGAAVTERGLS
jgi:hypothetical protein